MKKLLLVLLSLAVALPSSAQDFRTLDKVDPEYREAAKNWVIDFSDPQVRLAAQANNARRAVSARQPAEHWVAPAKDRQPAVDLYVYKPQNAAGRRRAAKLPVIYFIHGGGYLLGNAKQGGDSLQALADAQQAAVVSVEYRLAPQAPFPADLNDAYHGLRYVFEQADKHRLDANRVVLMGESAGGGLTARLALYTRDQGRFKPKGQVLIYPMLDYRTGTDASPYHNPNAGEFVWTPAANQAGWTALRNGQTLANDELPYYSAAMATKLDGLPPTYIMVGDLDLFVNEDIDYANRLIQAGVPTELQVIPGVFHAFELANPEGSATKRYLQARTSAIKAMLK